MDKQKLIKFAKIIIQEYLVRDVPPVETITKIASENKLTNTWVSRLAEVVNVSLHNNIREKHGSSMIQFDLIDPEVVVSKLATEKTKGKMSVSKAVAGTTELERGMAKAAAAEYYDIIDREINSHESNFKGMTKTASERNKKERQIMFSEKSIGFQKTATDILSRSDAMIVFLKERISNNIAKLASMIVKEGYPDNIGYALGSIRSSAKNVFKEKAAVDAIIDMVKVSSPTISKIKEFTVVSPGMNKEGGAYALLSSIVEDGKQANEYGKLSNLMRTHNLCKMAGDDKSLKMKMEKLAFIGGIVGKMVKNPLMGYFAVSDVTGLPSRVREDMGAPEKKREETGYAPMGE